MMKTYLSPLPVLWIIAAGITLGGCGKEAGRVPFTGEGTSTATVTLEAGEVAFWTDIDIEHEGDAALTYRIDLRQNGASVANAECNPLGKLSVKMTWVETNIGDAHSRRGKGKMSCSANLAKSGPTVVKAQLAFGTKPNVLALKKADLVLKQ